MKIKYPKNAIWGRVLYTGDIEYIEEYGALGPHSVLNLPVWAQQAIQTAIDKARVKERQRIVYNIQLVLSGKAFE